MIVAHNISAINTFNQMNILLSANKKAAEKLSSGFRINKAADDAAGLSISEKMRAQIRGLYQASDNANQGVSYVQVADGALNEVDTILHRIRELAVQSAHDTNSPEDRANLDSEVQQLKKEIDRIFETTEYNTMKIWTPTNPIYEDHVTEHKNTITDSTISWQRTSVTNYVTDANKESAPISNIYFSSTTDGFKVHWTALNGKNYESKEMLLRPELAGSYSYKLSDYMDYGVYPETQGIEFDIQFSIDEKATKEEALSSINNHTGYCYSYVYVTPSLKFEDGTSSVDNKIYVSNSSSNYSGDRSYTYFTYQAILETDKIFDTRDDTFISPTNGGNNLVQNACDTKNSTDKFVFTFTMPNIGNVTATSKNVYSTSKAKEGEDGGRWWYSYLNSYGERRDVIVTNTITSSNGVLGSYGNVVDALTANPSEPLGNILKLENGGILGIRFDMVADTPYTTATGSTISNLGSYYLNVEVSPGETADDIINRLSKISGLDFLDASSNKEYVSMNISQGTSGTSSKTITTYDHDYELLSYEDIDLYVHVGANPNQVINLNHRTLRNKILGLDDTNILTRVDANNAIDEVLGALKIVNEERSKFGAYQNRLEHTINSLNTTGENMTASESTIRDMDMASEMMEYTKSAILQQASQAMLTQAMQRPQQVLELLK